MTMKSVLERFSYSLKSRRRLYIIGSAVLKEGTPVRALRTNDWDALDIIDQSGNIWRLNMEMSETNGYGITIDGRSPDELFEGLILIWGGNDG